MKKTIDTTTNTITFSFGHGVAPLVFHPDLCNGAMREYAELHGFAARLGDAAAIPKQDAKGNVVMVTEVMRRDAVEALAKHYESGTKEWNLRTASVSVATAKSDAAAIAVLAELMEISVEEATALFVAKKG